MMTQLREQGHGSNATLWCSGGRKAAVSTGGESGSGVTVKGYQPRGASYLSPQCRSNNVTARGAGLS